MSLTKTKPFVTNVNHYNANNISLHTQDWKWLRSLSLHVYKNHRDDQAFDAPNLSGECLVKVSKSWHCFHARCLLLPFFHTRKRTLLPLKTPGSRSVIAAVIQSPRLISFGSTHFWVGVFSTGVYLFIGCCFGGRLWRAKTVKILNS